MPDPRARIEAALDDGPIIPTGNFAGRTQREVMRACRWPRGAVEERARLVAALRVAVEDARRLLACRCEECWTDRGRHAPECMEWAAEEIEEDVADALEGKP